MFLKEARVGKLPGTKGNLWALIKMGYFYIWSLINSIFFKIPGLFYFLFSFFIIMIFLSLWKILSRAAQKGSRKMTSNWWVQCPIGPDKSTPTLPISGWVAGWGYNSRCSYLQIWVLSILAFSKGIYSESLVTHMGSSIFISSVFSCSNHTTCKFLCKALHIWALVWALMLWSGQSRNHHHFSDDERVLVSKLGLWPSSVSWI